MEACASYLYEPYLPTELNQLIFKFADYSVHKRRMAEVLRDLTNRVCCADYDPVTIKHYTNFNRSLHVWQRRKVDDYCTLDHIFMKRFVPKQRYDWVDSFIDEESCVCCGRMNSRPRWMRSKPMHGVMPAAFICSTCHYNGLWEQNVTF